MDPLRPDPGAQPEDRRTTAPGRGIAVFLGVLWLVAMITGYTLGGLIHVFLVITLLLGVGPIALRVVRRAPGKAAIASAVLAVLVALWFVPVRRLEPDVAASTPPSEQPATFAAVAPWLPDDTMRGFVRIAGRRALATDAAGAPDPTDDSIRPDVLPFLIGKYEVTTQQYRECVERGRCAASDRRALEGADDEPVRYVTYPEAAVYSQWLGAQLEGSNLLRLLPGSSVTTLPTEEEWELAAAGEGARRYPWGLTFEPLVVNGGASGRSGVIGVGRLVRGATPNGLFDMSGNVAEWTTTAVSRVGTDVTRFRPEGRSPMLLPLIVRGGSFYDGPSLLTTTARAVADRNTAYDFVGFRVVIVQRISRVTGS